MAEPLANRILRVFADLAVDAQVKPVIRVASDQMTWLPLQLLAALSNPDGASADSLSRHQKATRLQKEARLSPGETRLRLGWLWVAGRDASDGAPIMFPLVSAPVEMTHARPMTLRLVGDIDLSSLIEEPAEAAALSDPIQLGGGALITETEMIDPKLLARLARLHAWAARASAAAGYPTASLVPVDVDGRWDPTRLGGTVVVAGLAMYLAEPAPPPVTSAATLRAWADEALPDTALHHLYGIATTGAGVQWPPAMSSLVLDPAQRAAVTAAQRQSITVVSGPPGTGKSQTVAAIALDAVAHGASVLVAAPSDAAVSALVDLLDAAPGPDPVVFGSAVRRAELAGRLAEQGSHRIDERELDRRHDAAMAAGVVHDGLRTQVAQLLDAEHLAAAGGEAELLHARIATPGFFDPTADLGRARDLLARARDERWWRSRGARKAGADLAAMSRASAPVGGTGAPVEVLAVALDAAERSRRASAAEVSGGITIGDLWTGLADAEASHRAAVGVWLDGFVRSDGRSTTAGREAVSVVASALRSGRAARRKLLATVPGDLVAAALPMWIGSLRDVDDLLPSTAAMFDLVIIDEASQVDQLSAVAALLRARRAVVVGDPRQLRHVSFVADEAIAGAIAANVPDADGLLASRLDVRRNSLFDAAAATSDARMLDQHYRGAPHLIEFSARHFYDRRLFVATRHPRNESTDCIDVVRVDGHRVDGVNAIDVDAVVAHVKEALAEGRSSLGVLSPFRAQADAIQAALLKQLSIEDIDALDLRVGTVHAFQGCERDEIVLSIALDPTSAAGSFRFVHDPNLFNVMVTRARRRMVIVTSLDGTATGLTAELLAQADRPPQRPSPTPPPTGWVADVATEAAARGITVLPNYPVGSSVVDLCVGTSDSALGVECTVHPDGVHPHIDRHLALMRAGWQLRDAFPTRWRSRLPELIVELSQVR